MTRDAAALAPSKRQQSSIYKARTSIGWDPPPLALTLEEDAKRSLLARWSTRRLALTPRGMPSSSESHTMRVTAAGYRPTTPTLPFRLLSVDVLCSLLVVEVL